MSPSRQEKQKNKAWRWNILWSESLLFTNTGEPVSAASTINITVSKRVSQFDSNCESKNRLMWHRRWNWTHVLFSHAVQLSPYKAVCLSLLLFFLLFLPLFLLLPRLLHLPLGNLKSTLLKARSGNWNVKHRRWKPLMDDAVWVQDLDADSKGLITSEEEARCYCGCDDGVMIIQIRNNLRHQSPARRTLVSFLMFSFCPLPECKTFSPTRRCEFSWFVSQIKMWIFGFYYACWMCTSFRHF